MASFLNKLLATDIVDSPLLSRLLDRIVLAVHYPDPARTPEYLDEWINH